MSKMSYEELYLFILRHASIASWAKPIYSYKPRAREEDRVYLFDTSTLSEVSIQKGASRGKRAPPSAWEGDECPRCRLDTSLQDICPGTWALGAVDLPLKEVSG